MQGGESVKNVTKCENQTLMTENTTIANIICCQAQPQIQLSWAELALILKNPASARPGLVPEKLPRKLKFDMQASFNPNRTNAVISSQKSHFVTIQTRHLTKKLI